MANDKMSFWEKINPVDPDSNCYIGDIPIVGKAVDPLFTQNEECQNVNNVKDHSVLVSGAGLVGGGLLGSKLGENFGTLGKLAGGVIGAWAGSKFSKEIASDVASASDFTANNPNSKKSQLAATISNFANFGGQTYTGKTAADNTVEV